jgi:hypothetical protein
MAVLKLLMSADERKRVESAMLKRHARKLNAGEHFALTHQRDADTETVMVDVVQGPAVFRFEAQVHLADVDPPELNPDLMLDFLDAVVTEWLAGDREAYPTLDFSPYEFRKVTIGLRGGLQRPDLEAMADALLAGANPHRNGDPHE